MKLFGRHFLTVALTGLALFSGSASAGLVTSRPALGGTDYIDWAQLGADYTVVTEPANLTSNLGLSAQLNNPNGPIEKRTQGSSWGGNFATGDALAWTNDAPGPLDITFLSGIAGAGAQIQRDSYGAFTASIAAYDSSNNLLESYLLVGNSSGAGDNSAIFIGLLRGTADIFRISFNVTENSDFAINRLSLVTTPVPEPGSLALLGLGLAGLGLRGRRKTR